MITLKMNEVHIWQVSPHIILDEKQLISLKKLLPQDELKKIEKYRFEKGKRSALITRVLARLVLAKYENVLPQSLSFTRSELGKPELQGSLQSLRFNLSHNDNLIICAVCLAHNIGCDVENVDRNIGVVDIATRFFSPSEGVDIVKHPIENQSKRFFEIWTLKEAFVKATGKGISQGLDSFSFKLHDNKKIELISPEPRYQNKNWQHALIMADEKL